MDREGLAESSLTEAEIRARLEARPDLLEAFEQGDLRVLGELLEVGLDTQVGPFKIRTPAT